MNERYRNIVPTFWTDPDIKRRLSLEQKALLLYFFTSPHSNMIGAYYLPVEYASAETGLDADTIRGHIAGPLAPFLTYDAATEEVLVYNMARHQITEELKGRDRRKPMVERLLAEIHSSRLRREFLRRYATWRLQVVVDDTTDTVATTAVSPAMGRVIEGPSDGASDGPSDGASHAPTEAIAGAGAGAATAAQQNSSAHSESQNLNNGREPSRVVELPAANAARPRVRGAQSAETPASWVAEAVELYAAAIGLIPHGRMGKALLGPHRGGGQGGPHGRAGQAMPRPQHHRAACAQESDRG